jgi:type I restriction enzyme S subunit
VIVFGDHTTEVKYVEFDFIVGADGVKIFEPIDGIVTADFLYYVFLFYSKDLSKVGGYSRHYKFMKNKPIPLPPLAEQRRIVAKIEELMPLIDRYEQAWSRMEDFNKRFPVDMQKSILQMAIQGKLVSQLPDEGTGEELYQQIQAEKQRLIKSGELRKTKALPKITAEDIPTDFPESWKVCYMDDIAFVTKLAGFEYTKNVAPNLVSNGIPLFKGKNVQNGKLVLKFESYIPETVSDELPRSQILK